MTIVRSLKGVYSAAALAGAVAVLQVPAEAQRADAVRLAAVSPKAEMATFTTIQQVKSVPRPKKRRCTG
jgi:hypothetical protein